MIGAIELPLMAELQLLMSRGGPVLWWLAALFSFFCLISLERCWFLLWGFPRVRQQWLIKWQMRAEQHSWFALSQRALFLGEAELLLKRYLAFLKLLLSLFPMLGLLGTVTGMVSVFEVMAIQGSAQPKLMASGISMATIPTMAGMVAALSAVFIYSRLKSLSEQRLLELERLMRSRLPSESQSAFLGAKQ